MMSFTFINSGNSPQLSGLDYETLHIKNQKFVRHKVFYHFLKPQQQISEKMIISE